MKFGYYPLDNLMDCYKIDYLVTKYLNIIESLYAPIYSDGDPNIVFE